MTLARAFVRLVQSLIIHSSSVLLASQALAGIAEIVRITSGQFLPLQIADRLGDYIVGKAIETIEIEKYISQYNDAVEDKVYTHGGKVDYVVDNLQEYTSKKGIKLNTVAIEDIYAPSEDADNNILAYVAAKNLKRPGCVYKECDIASTKTDKLKTVVCIFS